MSKVETTPVAVSRRRKDGQDLGFKVMHLTRVPSVGEHITYVAGAEEDKDDEPVYRVTNVTHFAINPGAGTSIAEVWTIEIAGDPGYGP